MTVEQIATLRRHMGVSTSDIWETRRLVDQGRRMRATPDSVRRLAIERLVRKGVSPGVALALVQQIEVLPMPPSIRAGV